MRDSEEISIRSAVSTHLVLLLAIASLLGPGLASPQSYLVHTYGRTDGIPELNVTGLAEDDSGTIWFATGSGPATFDGQVWQLPWVDDQELQGFSKICRDDHGKLWALLLGPEPLVAACDGNQPSSFPAPTQLSSSNSGQATTGFAVTTDQAGSQVAIGTEAMGLWLYKRGTWHHLMPEQGLPDTSVRALIGSGGLITVATRHALTVVSENHLDHSMTGLLPDGDWELLALAPGKQGELWLLATHWLGVIRAEQFTLISDRVRLAATPGLPAQVLPDPPQSVFYAAPYALFRFDLVSAEAELLGIDSGLISQGATALMLDREKNLWVGSLRGVSKIASMRFASYRKMHGLFENEVSAICEPFPGTLVFGHNAGLTRLNRGEFELIPLPTATQGVFGARRVLDMATSPDGTVWFSAGSLGLGELAPGKKMRWYGPRDGLPLPVTSVVRRPAGGFWVSSGGGVYRLAGSRIFPEILRPATVPMVRRLFVDSAGTLYAATGGDGILVAKDGSLNQVPNPEAGRANDVFAFLEDSHGRRWVGTRAGLFVFGDNRLQRPTQESLRVDGAIFLIIEDSQGNLWFGTDNGVVRFDGKASRHLGLRDGLAGSETNRGAGLVDSRGRLWIGTDNGVSRYQPELDQKTVPPPLLELTAVAAGGQEYPPYRPLELRHYNNTVEFHFRAISLNDEAAVRYRCRLSNFETDWTPEQPANQRSLRYTNLSPGRYQFHIEAVNGARVWSDQVTSGWITIQPPFWRQWWFIALVVIAMTQVVYWGAVVGLRLRYATRLKHEVARRTAELRESEERYRHLFADSVLAKLLLDPEKQLILDVNAAACRLLKRSREELVAQLTTAARADWLDGVFSNRQTQPTLGRSESGVVEVWTSTITLGGKRRLLITVQDVSERQRAEEERIRATRLSSLGLLAGGLAHDFNNILMGAMGNLSLARLAAKHARQVLPKLAATEAALHRAKDLTAQLSAFAKGGAPVCKITDLAGLLHDSANFVLAGSSTICHFEVADDLWPAEVDEGQLSQVIGNLVINADQAMAEGGTVVLSAANLEISTATDDLAPGFYVQVRVADDGPGIPAAIRDKIFDPYFTTREKGTGLGLATSYAIVRNHGGQVRVAPAPQGGAVFEVFIPAAPQEEAPAAASVPNAPGGSGRLLVMDDEADLREVFAQMLDALGYEVELASDGREACDRYAEAKDQGLAFAAVIMDLTVPGAMGGKAAIRELLQLDPGVKAIVASGYSNDPILANHRAAGFRGVLRKPFTISELARELDGVLKGQVPLPRNEQT